MSSLLFGIKLSIFRRMTGPTQAAAAKKIGIDEKAYEDLEYAQHEPRAGLVRQVEDALGIRFAPGDFETWIDEQTADLVLGRRPGPRT